MMAGVNMTRMPYKGTGPMLVDLIKGQIGLAINDMSSLSGHISSGKQRAVAVMGGARKPALPGVPTASLRSSTCFGLLSFIAKNAA